MRILLLGDYSNVHATLAKGLRTLGHKVTVASDGDGWKGYARDIDLRREGLGARHSARYLAKLVKAMAKMRGYDVVQLINPLFLTLRPERIMPFYRYLRRHNGRVVMGAFGMDYYWVKACLDFTTFRYSDFNIGHAYRQCAQNDSEIAEWYNGPKGILTQRIAADVDAIVAGLYEYDVAYRRVFPEKLHFIPFPIDLGTAEHIHRSAAEQQRCVRFFIGIQRSRSEYKGTDIMLRALERVKRRYPEACEVVRVENVPFAQYKQLLCSSDVLLDQLYSYTPAMNALQAMAQGLVVVGGGEPENYDILGCHDLRPIINVLPSEDDVYQRLCHLVEHRDTLPHLSADSIAYVRRYHDHLAIAQQYLDLWQSL